MRALLSRWSSAPAKPASPQKPGLFVGVLALVVILNVIGLVMVLSASSVESLRQYGSSWYFFGRQVLWLVVGAAAMALTVRIDYRTWRRWSRPFLLACLVMLFFVLVPGIGVSVGGSSRWLGAGSLRLQPSELTKLALVLFGADLLARRADRMGDWRATLRPMLIIFGLAGAMVFKQPDLGTALVLACITLGLLWCAGTRLATMSGVVVLLMGGAFISSVMKPYQRARLLSFTNPLAHASNSGYQVVQSLVGLTSGHLFGVGLGASRAKWGFLPNAYTDFIFSIIGEELGLIGAVLVIGLFVALAVLGIRVAARSPDRFGALTAAGITCWIVSQAVINIGAVVGALPVSGVPLPFVSYGGSSLAILMAATGVLLNVAGQTRGGQSRGAGQSRNAAAAAQPKGPAKMLRGVPR